MCHCHEFAHGGVPEAWPISTHHVMAVPSVPPSHNLVAAYQDNGFDLGALARNQTKFVIEMIPERPELYAGHDE